MTDAPPRGAIAPAVTSAMPDARRASPADLLSAAHTLLPEFRTDLAHLVGIDSGSWNAAGVARVGGWCAERLVQLGFAVEQVPTPRVDGRDYADVVIGRRRGTGRGRVLLFGHLDTVFPDGTAAERPYREADGRAYGPGVCDDTGGFLAGLAAARVLDLVGDHGYAELVIALTPDEEVGAPASRHVLAALAAQVDAALCLECARENGDIVGARKGVADVVVDIAGRAAHAGVEPERGVSAAVEAAHLVLELQSLNGRRPGLSVNVGQVSAGERANVVPADARLTVEVRAQRLIDLEEALDHIDERARSPLAAGASITATRRDVCPPLERAATAELAEVAVRIATTLGLNVGVAATGGASDANFVAATGVRTLDGLGPVGGGDHGVDEWLDLDSVAPRVALLAALIVEVGR